MSINNQLEAVLTEIKDINARDPNREEDEHQNAYPKELLYSIRMLNSLLEYEPRPSPTLQIAACAQHIERWKSPRSDFPEGKAGYKKWRTQLGGFHAERTANVMEKHGFDAANIIQVKKLLQKRELKKDPETQALEDVICIVFIKYYLDDFARKHTEDKLITIIQKTWNKMSDKGHKKALALPLKEDILNLITKALYVGKN